MVRARAIGKRTKLFIIAGLVVGAVALTATVALASGSSATLSAEQQAAKAALSRYQSVQQALKAG